MLRSFTWYVQQFDGPWSSSWPREYNLMDAKDRMVKDPMAMDKNHMVMAKDRVVVVNNHKAIANNHKGVPNNHDGI